MKYTAKEYAPLLNVCMEYYPRDTHMYAANSAQLIREGGASGCQQTIRSTYESNAESMCAKKFTQLIGRAGDLLEFLKHLTTCRAFRHVLGIRTSTNYKTETGCHVMTFFGQSPM